MSRLPRTTTTTTLWHVGRPRKLAVTSIKITLKHSGLRGLSVDTFLNVLLAENKH